MCGPCWYGLEVKRDFGLKNGKRVERVHLEELQEIWSNGIRYLVQKKKSKPYPCWAYAITKPFLYTHNRRLCFRRPLQEDVQKCVDTMNFYKDG